MIDGIDVEYKYCRPKYVVTIDGRVFSEQAWNGSNFRELKQEHMKLGYRRVALYIHPIRERVLVHVLVAEAFLPPKEHPNQEVRHLDGNPAHNHVSNLAWGYHTENAQDSFRHGTFVNGSRNGNALLTEAKVAEIKILIKQKTPLSKIAEEFGVTKATIANISCGRSWKHV